MGIFTIGGLLGSLVVASLSGDISHELVSAKLKNLNTKKKEKQLLVRVSLDEVASFDFLDTRKLSMPGKRTAETFCGFYKDFRLARSWELSLLSAATEWNLEESRGVFVQDKKELYRFENKDSSKHSFACVRKGSKFPEDVLAKLKDAYLLPEEYPAPETDGPTPEEPESLDPKDYAPILRNGKTYPGLVSLTDNFRSEVPRQTGTTCHIYAATALFEEACHRATGQKIDLSEGYAYYLHWRNKFKDQGYLTSGGRPQKTLRRMLKGYVVTEEELDLNVEGFHREIRELYLDLLDLGDISRELDRLIEEKIEQTKYIKFIGQAAESQDSRLHQCLDQMESSIPNLFNHTRAISLLASGRPFICKGRINRWGPEAHVVTIVGYRSNHKYRSGIEYQIRDSGPGNTSWGGDLACSEGIEYLELEN